MSFLFVLKNRSANNHSDSLRKQIPVQFQAQL
jgi:hypothetical protein